MLGALLSIGIGTAASAPAAQSYGAAGQPAIPGVGQPAPGSIDDAKAGLQAQASQALNSADANINALKRMSGSETGQVKQEHEDMISQLTTASDQVRGDVDKIQHASVTEWPSLASGVQRDIGALNTQLQRASAVTKLPVPK
jgi:hypothetical protein